MKASKLGILSALIASACCVGPLLLILLGLGSLGIGAAIGKYHWYFILAAFALIGFAWRSYLKEKKTCNLKGCQMENKRITLIILILSTFIVVIFVGLNFYTYAIQKDYMEEKAEGELIETKMVIIPVDGMTCFACEVAVSTALKKVDGVVSAVASAKKKIVSVRYNPNKTNITQLIAKINESGYRASLPK